MNECRRVVAARLPRTFRSDSLGHMLSLGKFGAVRWVGVALLGATAFATFAAAPGCADNNTMVFIRAIVPPTKGCGYDGTIDQSVITVTYGALD